MSSKQQALVFGASGISGWAIVRTALVYPTATTFSRVIALSNRPLAKGDFLLQNGESDRVDIYSGIDLTEKNDAVVDKLKKVPNIGETTHIYYAAYLAHGSDFQTSKAANVSALVTAVNAAKTLCPKLIFFSLQTGAKAYGLEFYGQPGVEYNVPLKESAPRLPEPYASNIFYYAQCDELERLSKDQTWKWCEVRPDVIVGHVPRSNGIGLAHALGLYLAMYRDVKGEGSELPFPGNQMVWGAAWTDTSQDILAKFHIFASLNEDKSQARSFNVGDKTSSWKETWPAVCSYFGLNGVEPRTTQEPSGVEWVMSQKDNWAQWVQKHELKEGFLETATWDVMGLAFNHLVFDKQLSLDLTKEIGFTESITTETSFREAFDRMKEAKIIP